MPAKKKPLPPYDPLAPAREDPLRVRTLIVNPALARNTGQGVVALLARFPVEVLACTKIGALDLYNCFGAASVVIPKELGSLGNLVDLCIGQTPIKKLPNEIGALKKLKTLSLMYNYALTALPPTLGDLGLLEELYLQYCVGLRALPSSIGALKKLHILHLNDTPLTALPSTFPSLTSLRELTLPDGLTRLPKGFGALTKLTDLTASAAALASVRDELGGLRALRMVTVAGPDPLAPEIAALLPKKARVR